MTNFDPTSTGGTAIDDDTVVITKVRKLLAMAESTSNVNEADAFSRKAAELIASHRIDPDRLRAESNDDLGIWEVPLGRGAYVRGRLSLLQAIAHAQGCQVVFEARSAGTVALVAGFRSDLRSTEMLHGSLHAQAASRMGAERRATAAATQQWRRAFLFGYANQLSRMFDEAAAQVHEQVHPSQAALPALRARDRRVAEYGRQKFGPVRAARRPKPANRTGWQAGEAAARRADIGRGKVVGLRAIASGE